MVYELNCIKDPQPKPQTQDVRLKIPNPEPENRNPETSDWGAEGFGGCDELRETGLADNVDGDRASCSQKGINPRLGPGRVPYLSLHFLAPLSVNALEPGFRV